jgi:Uncharacterised nucleotidyltransferase
LRYVLRRAFGMLEEPITPLEPRAVLRWAEALDVSGRLTARTEPERLLAELGRRATLVLLARQAALRLQSAARARHVRALLAAAAEVELPIVLLKTAAHEALGLVAAGTRRAGDVDVLAPAREAPRLQRALVQKGWRERGLRAHGHQLAPLVEPGGGVVECHLYLPGVRVSGTSRDADFDALRGALLLEASPEFPGTTFVPGPTLLRAHVVAHGLWQHWLTPQSYPLGRLLSDGLDLGLDSALKHAPDTIDPERRDLLALVAPRVASQELDPLVELLARLRVAEPTLLEDGEAGAARRLLDHIVAGSTDPNYVRTLRRAHTRRAWAKPSRWPQLLLGALWPSSAQLDLLYGDAQGRARLWQRLRRPLDLALRALD